jgi:hypothetical protein
VLVVLATTLVGVVLEDVNVVVGEVETVEVAIAEVVAVDVVFVVFVVVVVDELHEAKINEITMRPLSVTQKIPFFIVPPL